VTSRPLKKTRADLLLVERGIAESREKAKVLILAGKVFYSLDGKNFHRLLKPSQTIPPSAEFKVEEDLPYVSRGGLKLEQALNFFEVDPSGLVCLDVGASTGGFTDCLLQRGAKRVYAVDVGKGLLHPKIREDPRVVVLEGINARYLTPSHFPEKMDLITVDVSFISLKKVLPALKELLIDSGLIIALIKPQFELSPKEVKKGIVRDPKLHLKVVNEIWEFAKDLGFEPLGVVESPILGAKGNKEFLICLRLKT
jgi:23S rRNA (cytidine1920-2'-O)/16S rRNA (cytidine1409-2'-O)-methyltransferase